MTSEHIDTERPATGDGAFGWFIGCMAHEASPADHRNIRRYGVSMMIWGALVMADADWFGGQEGVTSVASVTLAIASIGALVSAVLAFARYVRETDELNRFIQLRSLAIGFAAGFITGMVGEAALDAGLVDRVDVDVPVLAMLITYAATSVVITRRYR